MELSYSPPQTVKFVIPRKESNDFSSFRSQSYTNDNLSEFLDATSLKTPLRSRSMSASSSFSNDSYEDSGFYYNNSGHNFSSNGYSNLRIQERDLPPVPENQEQNGCYASCESTSCPSCECSKQSRDKTTCTFISRRILIGTTVLSLVLSGSSFGLSVMSFWTRERVTSELGTGTFKEGDYHACVACAQLPEDDWSSAQLKNQLATKFAGSETLCCAWTSGQMSVLMQLMMKQKNTTAVQVPMTKESYIFSPVSAHKHLHNWSEADRSKYESGSATNRNTLKIIPNEDSIMEHIRHVTSKNNSLQIQFSGWYFVYSSLHFQHGIDKPCSSLRHQTWGHFISRRCPNRKSKSGTLVQTAHTCCNGCTEDYHTSYAGGVFMLEAGDEVYVDVSGSGLRIFEGEGSYFGLVMLGSWHPVSNKNFNGSDNNIDKK